MLAFIICFAFSACFEQPIDSAQSDDNSHALQEQDTPSVEEILVDATQLSVNPLTGQSLPEGVVNGRRPVAIMVNNAKASLPQRGIAQAEAIIEMETEGGITRLMAMYSDAATVPQVGSIRSARDQHLQFAIPTNAIAVHIGTSVYASNLLNNYAYKTIDGRYQGTTAFWFDELRSKTIVSDHCWYTDAALIAAGIQHEQLPTTGVSYPLVNFAAPNENPQILQGGSAPNVSFTFTSINTTQFVFNSATNSYKKYNYSSEHIDESGAQLAFENVLVLFSEVGLKNDNYCLDYNLSGGSGYYFYGGNYLKITWEKGAPELPLTIKDENGEIFNINTGKTYIGVVNSENESSVVFDFNAAV